MLDKRKTARDFLEEISLTELHNVVDEAKLTPRQKGIIEMKFVKDWSYVQISLKLHIDVNVIKEDMRKSYDKIYKLFSIIIL